ncbi:LysR substrate-binding domain-containing protein [Marinobacterium maritimum]|uniref:LysR substrate-binding domain-containing protein n=1 Tax=Marinobacterium maritimum TaxID=500162 RepID=A0ABN1I7C0_9GAMM
MFARLPSLSSLRTFEAAARLLSFKSAAHELNVSPTAVSHQIRALEDRLQLCLFERRTRSVELTPEGERLAAAAHKAMHELNETVNELTRQANQLTVGTTASFAALWLVPKLHLFQQQYPGVELNIQAEDQLRDVEQDRRVDMVIRYGCCPQANAEASLLGQEALGLFATPAYWQQLSVHSNPSVLVTSWKNPRLPRPNVQAWLQTIEQMPSAAQIRSFDDENQVIQAALAGQGIALVSRLLVALPLHNGWLTAEPWKGVDNLRGLDYYTLIPERSASRSTVRQFASWLDATLKSGLYPRHETQN